MSMGKNTLLSGFEKFVIKNPEGCWGWSGCIPKNPRYGQFRHNMKLERAHRASWIIHFGEIPTGMFVLHKCDNSICSNPDHLFLGNNYDNNKDAYLKGRNKILWAYGEKNPRAKFTNQQIKEIRSLNLNNRQIAKIYKVSPTTVGRIKRNLSWKEGVNH